MKKAIIHAYTHLNLGDDLFIKILIERYPDVIFKLYAPKEYKYVFNQNKNISIYSKDFIGYKALNLIFRKIFGVFKISRKIISRKCDVGIFIGGSLFVQNKNFPTDFKDISNMKLENQPFFLLGANFGPFQDDFYYNSYRNLFDGYEDISFREKKSFDLFKDMNNVRIASDIVFQLEAGDINTKKNVVISVIKPSKKDGNTKDNEYYNKIKDITVEFVAKGTKVTLMSFCEHEGDREAIEEILYLLPNSVKKDVDFFNYNGNIEEALTVLRESSCIVASRFHAMILGWVFEKPVFPIVYSSKMTNVMNDVGYDGNYVELNEITLLSAQHVVKEMSKNKVDVTLSKIDSANHFKVLDSILK